MEYNLTGALPDDLSYAPKAPGAPSRAFRMVVGPLNSGAQNPGDIMRFDVPVGRPNAFIDTDNTYLLFQVKSTGAATPTNDLTIQGSAYCFFNRLTVLSQGQVLEDIQNYNVLCNALLDVQMGAVDAATTGSVHLGTGTDSAQSQNIVKFGQSIAANGGVKEFALPLALSGVLGSGCSKYLPVQKVNDLRLELVLETVINSVVGTSPNWQILQPQLVLQYVEIEPHMAAELERATGGRYLVSTTSWRNYSSVLSTASRTADSILIPARYSSLRTLLSVWRNNTNISDGTKYNQIARVNPFYGGTSGLTSSIQWSIGSVLVPQSPLRFGTAETFLATQQAFHQLSSITNGTRCYLANWNQNAYGDTATYTPGTFVLAQNFDSFTLWLTGQSKHAKT